MHTPKLFRRSIIEHTRNASPITPRCPHAPPRDMCGGCTFGHVAYADQINAKQQALVHLWQELLPADMPTPQIVASPDDYTYRTRMDFIASKGRFGLRRGGKFNYIIDLSTCHLIPPEAFAVAHGMWQHSQALGLPDYNLRSHEGFLRYIVVRRSPHNQYLIAMITSQPRDEHDEAAMAQIAQTALANPAVVGVHWLRNDGPADVSFGTPYKQWGAALLSMHVGGNVLAIGPNTFFQNNVYLLEHLLGAITTAVGDATHVADLYGGVGTIALSLASRVGHVHSVESFAESVTLCQHNINHSNHHNVTCEVADVATFLRQHPSHFDTMVVDPPRVGLGPDVCLEILRHAPQRLVYVSCNPLSQVADATVLLSDYRLVSLAG
ncbi:MAG: methyltransferase, partial [Chloroflexaceae bacterium]|nr:methyltransferase [Chloroflexaceae bacterium]